MNWEEVLFYKEEVRYMCRKWANSYDIDSFEDLVHHTYIELFEKVEIGDDVRNERNYILGAINIILLNYFKNPENDMSRVNRKYIFDSLDFLKEFNILEITENHEIVYPPPEYDKDPNDG